MVRYVSALALALAIASSGAFVSEALAKVKPGVCKQATLTGKVKTWSCKTDQVCCSLPTVGYYGCGKKTLGGCIKL